MASHMDFMDDMARYGGYSSEESSSVAEESMLEYSDDEYFDCFFDCEESESNSTEHECIDFSSEGEGQEGGAARPDLVFSSPYIRLHAQKKCYHIISVLWGSIT